MKYFLLLLCLFTTPSWGFSPLLDIRDKTEIHFLDNLVPSTFYDIKRGEAFGGVLTEVISYRFLGAMGGIQKNLSGGWKYEPVFSVGIKLDYFKNAIVRKISGKAPLLQRMTVGPYIGYGFSDSRWVYGAAMTVKFDIENLRKNK